MISSVKTESSQFRMIWNAQQQISHVVIVVVDDIRVYTVMSDDEIYKQQNYKHKPTSVLARHIT